MDKNKRKRKRKKYISPQINKYNFGELRGTIFTSTPASPPGCECCCPSAPGGRCCE